VATCPNCGVQVNTGTGALVETGSSEEE
jgi:hypothetical protein